MFLFVLIVLLCYSVNELVHKHAYFATFLSLLHTHPVDPKSKFDEQAPTELAADPWEEEKQRQQEGSTAEPKPEEEEEKESKTEEPKEPEKPSELVNVALLVLQHLDSNLGLAVSQSDWRSVRFHLRFFALCASSAVVFKPMVDLASLGHVLAQLAEGVLAKEEHGLAVKDEVATAVGEALLLLPLSEATQAARAALKQHQAKRKTASAAKLHSSNYVDVSIHVHCTHASAHADKHITDSTSTPFARWSKRSSPSLPLSCPCMTCLASLKTPQPMQSQPLSL